jgi:hypothetical protein
MQMNSEQITQTIKICGEAGVPLLIHGSPATSKSSLVKQFAEDNQLHLIDIRLSQSDITDLRGLPNVMGTSGKSEFLPPVEFILEGDEIPDNKEGVLLLLDELGACSPAIQVSAYKIILDRQINEHNLHPNTVIVGTTNLLTDRAVVIPMSTALRSRMTHVTLEVNVDAWLKWASLAGIEPSIRAYIDFRRKNLYNFKPDVEGSYANPRSWEFVSNILQNSKGEPVVEEIISGLVGKGVAREFMKFNSIKMPSVSDLMGNPSTVKLPTKIDEIYAFSGLLISIGEELSAMSEAEYKGTELSVNALKILLERIPREFKVLVVKQLLLGDWDEEANENELQDMINFYSDQSVSLSKLLFD